MSEVNWEQKVLRQRRTMRIINVVFTVIGIGGVIFLVWHYGVLGLLTVAVLAPIAGMWSVSEINVTQHLKDIQSRAAAPNAGRGEQ